MLGKLIKYDLLKLGRVLLPVQLIAVGVSVIVTLINTFQMRFAARSFSMMSAYSSNTLAESALGVLFMAFLASIITTLILVGRHFYFNIYSDEGYLTMTLPATTNQHIIAKTISGFIWVLISMLVMVIGVALFLFFGLAHEGLFSREVVATVGSYFTGIARHSPLLFLVYPFSLALSYLSSLLCIYACITAGCAWAKRHRVALSLGLIFAAWFVMSIFNAIIEFVVSLAMNGWRAVSGINFLFFGDYQPLYDQYLVTLVIGCVVSLALIVAYYAFAHSSLGNRLNLE